MTYSVKFRDHLKTFSTGQEAVEFYALARKKGLPESDLILSTPAHPSVYESHVPTWVASLAEKIENDYAHIAVEKNRQYVVPRIHWINKKEPYGFSTGTSYEKYRDKEAHIAISACGHVYDQQGVFLHEVAHAICPDKEHHGREFYRTLFKLLRQYVGEASEQYTVDREAKYKKSSRYWYAEMYNIESTLAEYRPRAAARQPKPTTEDILRDLFKEN